MCRIPGGEDGPSGDGCQADDQRHEECQQALAAACLPLVRAGAAVQEAAVDLAEGGVAGGVGVDPGRGFGGGLQDGTGVQVGRVAGAAVPVGGGVVQPGADDPVGVGVGEPGVAQQRPGGQQRLVADLDGSGGQGEQPFGGEGFQDRLHVPGSGCAGALGQFRPGGAVGDIRSVAAGGGQPQEDLPGGGLLAGRQAVVGAVGAASYGAVDAAGAFVIGQGECLACPAPPGLVQGVRQQR